MIEDVVGLFVTLREPAECFSVPKCPDGTLVEKETNNSPLLLQDLPLNFLSRVLLEHRVHKLY